MEVSGIDLSGNLFQIPKNRPPSTGVHIDLPTANVRTYGVTSAGCKWLIASHKDRLWGLQRTVDLNINRPELAAREDPSLAGVVVLCLSAHKDTYRSSALVVARPANRKILN
ncbi:hypothetical protein TNCV_1533291 [Trichonephila clavipes]|nr:hypothetical protein TNCV_1533291 [Trichonephila clavipes]